MEESQVILQWQAKALERGLEQGRQQGLEEGLQQGLRDALLLLLEQRFSAPLPADLLARIQGTTDPGEIRRLLSLAATAASLDELRAALGG